MKELLQKIFNWGEDSPKKEVGVRDIQSIFHQILKPITGVKNGSSLGLSFKRKLGTGGDFGSASGNNIFDFTAGDILTFYFSSDTDNSFLSIDSLNFSLIKLN